jgi:hypothetical protein
VLVEFPLGILVLVFRQLGRHKHVWLCGSAKGQGVGGEDFCVAQDERSLKRIPQFAHIARPMVRSQRSERRRRNRGKGSAELLTDVANEE